jgi:spermidine synthase
MTKDKELVFNEDSIFLKSDPNIFVMMDWERELMKSHVDLLPNGDILEIGFGMGISAQYIQEKGVKSHTIFELNPQILEKLKEWSLDKPNVKIIEGDWCEVKYKIIGNKYDGIFYDADCLNSLSFRKLIVDKHLKKDGVFTYFEPMGRDRYGYNDKLKIKEIVINCDIKKNIYHNDKVCKVPYFIN